jgi:hypothetical protein
VRSRDLADLGRDVLAQLRRHRIVAFVAGLQGDESDDRLPHQVVRSRDDGGLGDLVVVHQRGFDLEGRETVTGDVHHVVDPAEEPEVPLLVSLRTVAGDVDLGAVLREVGLHVSVGVSPDRPRDGRPRSSEDEVPAPTQGNGIAFVIEDVGLDARERDRGRPGLELGDPRERRDQDRPGLGLPPGVDDRRSFAADDLPVPDPGLRVDRLAHGPEEPDRREVVLLRELRAPAHERADRGGRGVEDRRPVRLHDGPPTVLVGPIRRALVHDPRRVVRERPVDDVGVAGDPPAVGGAPEDVVVVDVEDHPVRRGDLGQVPAGRVRDPLRLPGRAARVEEVQDVLGVHLLRRALRGLITDQIVVPDVPARRERVLVLASSERDHVLDARALRDGLVRVRLQRDDLSPAPGAVRGDEDLRLGVVDPVAERIRAEAAEHDRMRSSDPRAREHGDRQLRHHPEVDVHSVALAHTQRAETVGEAADLVEEVAVGDRPRVSRLALPVVRDLVAAPRRHMPIETVHGRVQGSSHEPLHERRRPLHDRVPRSGPLQLARLLRPERFGVLGGALVDLRVGDEGPVDESLGWREHPLLLQERLDVLLGLGHAGPSCSSRAPS